MSEWLTEACCSPGVDGGGVRTLFDSSAAAAPPVRMDSAASSSDANNAAFTIHSVESSVSDEGEQRQRQQQQPEQQLSESLSKSLTLTRCSCTARCWRAKAERAIATTKERRDTAGRCTRPVVVAFPVSSTEH